MAYEAWQRGEAVLSADSRCPRCKPSASARLGRRLLLGVLAIGAGLVAPFGIRPVAALGPIPIGTEVTPIAGGTPLGPAHPVLTFAGQFANPTQATISNPDPTVCAAPAHCQLWTLEVATDRPFMVSVHNDAKTFNADNGFALSVYDPSGTVVGSSGGVGSDGQAVQVLSASPGRYTVAVTVTYAYADPVSYLGEARLLTPPSWRHPTPTACTLPSGQRGQCILPRLEALPPSDVRVTGLPPVASTPLGFPLPVGVDVPTSCYADEALGLDSLTVLPPTVPSQLSHPTLRCLRFTTDVRDIGGGPLVVRWDFVSGGRSPQIGYLPGQCHAEQVVRLAGGGEFVRPAGDCVFHLAHGHFHYSGLVSFALFTVGPNGAPGHLVAAASKKSFCLSSDDYFGFGTPGPANGPRLYFGQPGCNIPAAAAGPAYGATGIARGAPQQDVATESDGIHGSMGISPGWGDVYTWDTPGQDVDITSVPDGTYDIVMLPNPDHLLLTAGDDRCGITEIELRGTTVTVLNSWESTTECGTVSANESAGGTRSASSPAGTVPSGGVAALSSGAVSSLPNTTGPGRGAPAILAGIAALATTVALRLRRRLVGRGG